MKKGTIFRGKFTTEYKEAESFKEIRKLSGLTQEKFSVKFGIPKRTIEDWDRGKCIPSDYVLNMIKYILSNEDIKK